MKKKYITLISSIKKTNYYNFSIKKNNENKKSINSSNNKRKLEFIQTVNISPLAQSFEPEEKKNKNGLLIGLYKNLTNIKVLNNKLKNKYLQKGKLKIVNNKLSFSGVSTNNTFESNIINSFNQKNNNNFFIDHKKIIFSNSINYPMNKNKKNKVKNKSYINFENANKYKTIFTKYNTSSNKNKNIFEEPNYYFEVFSSKYNKNKKEEKNISELNNQLFNNEEINKVEFHKFHSSTKRNKKYYDTEISSNSDNIYLENKQNYRNFLNIKNMKIFSDSYKPKKKDSKVNLKFIIQNIKNKSINNIQIFDKFLNNKNYYMKKYYKHYKNNNRVKYSSIDLNILAQIPNRIMPIDNHGNEINDFKYNKKKLIQNDNIKFNSLKQSFGDIKILRKQFLDFHSNNITRNNSKKILDIDNIKITKNRIFKTFYQTNTNYLNLNNEEKLNQTKNRKNYFLSGKIRKKTKKFLNLKTSDNIEINFIS